MLAAYMKICDHPLVGGWVGEQRGQGGGEGGRKDVVCVIFRVMRGGHARENVFKHLR